MPRPIKYKDGYYVDFGYAKGGTRVRKWFSRKKHQKPYQAALQFIDSYLHSGQGIKVGIQRSISDYIKNMEITGVKKPSTISADYVRLRIFEKWCSENDIKTLDELTKTRMYVFQEYYLSNAPFYNTKNGKRKNYNPLSTWNRYFHIVSALIRWAVERELLDQSYLLKNKDFYRKPNEVFERWFTTEERDTLLDYFDNLGDDKLSCFYRMLAFTGIRPSEAINLTWDKVDITNKLILIDKATKNSKRRSVEIHIKKLLPYLNNIRSKNKHVFDNDYDGRYLSRDAYYKRLMTATKVCGIKPGNLKAFRHCFGSVLAILGASQKEIMEAMGHASIVTSGRYMHLSPSHLSNRINSL